MAEWKRVMVGWRVPSSDPEQKATGQPEATSFGSKSPERIQIVWDANKKDKKRGLALRQPHWTGSDPSQKPVSQPASPEGSPTNPFSEKS